MGIVYKITCDRCAKEYPQELDSEMHYGSFFGTHPDDAALEIQKNSWVITLENDVLCPSCSAHTRSDISATNAVIMTANAQTASKIVFFMLHPLFG